MVASATAAFKTLPPPWPVLTTTTPKRENLALLSFQASKGNGHIWECDVCGGVVRQGLGYINLCVRINAKHKSGAENQIIMRGRSTGINQNSYFSYPH